MFNPEKTMYIPSIEANPDIWESLREALIEQTDNGILIVW